MTDFDDIGWGDSIRESVDKRSSPPQGGSGVKALSNFNTTINFHLGYKTFDTATDAIDKIIAKYGGKCKINISTSLDFGDGKKELCFEDTYADILSTITNEPNESA